LKGPSEQYFFGVILPRTILVRVTKSPIFCYIIPELVQGIWVVCYFAHQNGSIHPGNPYSLCVAGQVFPVEKLDQLNISVFSSGIGTPDTKFL
jgi:hypothetical protein